MSLPDCVTRLPVRSRVRIREVDVVCVVVERMPNVDFLLSRGRVRQMTMRLPEA